MASSQVYVRDTAPLPALSSSSSMETLSPRNKRPWGSDHDLASKYRIYAADDDHEDRAHPDALPSQAEVPTGALSEPLDTTAPTTSHIPGSPHRMDLAGSSPRSVTSSRQLTALPSHVADISLSVKEKVLLAAKPWFYVTATVASTANLTSKPQTRALRNQLEQVIGSVDALIRLPSSAFLLKLQSQKQALKLIQHSSLGPFSLEYDVPRYLYVVTGRVSGVPIDITISDILGSPAGHSIYKIRQLPDRVTPASCHSYVLEFLSHSLPADLKVAHQLFEIEPHVPAPLQCAKCHFFGHHEDSCQLPASCSRCGNSAHDRKTCLAQSVARCVNCQGEHSARYRGCPVFQRELQIKSYQRQHYCSRRTAERAVVPLRSLSTHPATYAAAAASDARPRYPDARSSPSHAASSLEHGSGSRSGPAESLLIDQVLEKLWTVIFNFVKTLLPTLASGSGSSWLDLFRACLNFFLTQTDIPTACSNDLLSWWQSAVRTFTPATSS